MTTKIKRGGDIPVKFTVLEEGEQKNMNAATALSWRLSSVEYGCRRLPRITVVGGDNPYTVIVHTTAETPLGLYFLTLDFEDQGARRSVDAVAFQLVEHSSTCSCIDPDKAICILADTCIGQPGPAGLTPYIGDNGNWWIGDQDTGKPSQGSDGHSPVITADAAGNIYADGKLLTGVIPEAIDLLKQQEESAARAEAERAAAETKRAQEEAQREKQEQQRQTQTAQAIENVNQAAGEATQAGQTAQRAAETATAAASGATQAASAASDAAAKAQTAAGEANAAASSAAQAAKEAQTAAKAAEEAGVRADTAADTATQAAGTAESATASATNAAASAEAAATSAHQGAEAAAEAAQNAKEATDAILALPVVRTDIEQTITPEGKTTARRNIEAVGYLRVAITSGEGTAGADMTLTTSLDALSASYRSYLADTGHYRWTVILSNQQGNFVEEAAADFVQTAAGGLLTFFLQSNSLHYVLRMTVEAGTVTNCSIELFEPARQRGVATAEGGVRLTGSDLTQYAGDRTVQILFRTGADVTAAQQVRASEPLGFAIENGQMVVDMWGESKEAFAVQPATLYHVVATLDFNNRAVVVFSGSDNVAQFSRTDGAEPVYSGDMILGNTSESNAAFGGVIILCRDFNFILDAEQIAGLYNDGNPAAYLLSEELRRMDKKTPFVAGSYMPSRNIWAANNIANTSRLNDQPQANGFSGDYMRFDATPTQVSLYNAYSTNYIKRAFEVVYLGEYRSSGPVDVGAAASLTRLLPANPNTALHMTVTVKAGSTGGMYVNERSGWLETRVLSIQPACCIAEYLPRNIIGRRWLDSSLQFPLFDGQYQPPLLASDSGYDLLFEEGAKTIYDFKTQTVS